MAEMSVNSRGDNSRRGSLLVFNKPNQTDEVNVRPARSAAGRLAFIAFSRKDSR